MATARAGCEGESESVLSRGRTPGRGCVEGNWAIWSGAHFARNSSLVKGSLAQDWKALTA